jgi:TrmH family RNA methyltransferase
LSTPPIRLSRPGADPFTQRSPRVVAARRLLRRRHRDAEGLFLAEGPQAVREAVDSGGVTELFGTIEAYGRHRDLVNRAHELGAQVWPVTEPALAGLADTVTPQGIVAVCRQLHRDHVAAVLAPHTRLVVVLAGIADPGNAGTILRTADAAGADVVVFPDGTVDPYNGKCVRASAGSLFHVDLVRGGNPAQAVRALTNAGLAVLAADAHGADDLDACIDAGALSAPTAWLFGSEAHGLPPELAELAQARVRVPIHGRAESLNLAAAAAVCLYASAREQHREQHRGELR